MKTYLTRATPAGPRGPNYRSAPRPPEQRRLPIREDEDGRSSTRSWRPGRPRWFRIDGAALAADSGEANNEPPAAKKKSKHDLRVEAAYQAGLAGADAPVLTITSAANLSYQKRADKLREVAMGADRAALADVAIGGVNTYAQKLRAYQLELAAWIVGHKEHTKQEGQG